jgi:hypothetical protein
MKRKQSIAKQKIHNDDLQNFTSLTFATVFHVIAIVAWKHKH